MKILFLDIETTPNIVYRWGLWDKSPVSLNQVIEPSKLLCFAAKFKGGPKRPEFFDNEEIEDTLGAAHLLLDEADVVVHYNGDAFDIPILNAEFAMAGMAPPSPYKSIDLYKVYKKQFKMPSGKLEYVSKALGLEGKISHEGFSLWTGCMAGDPKAWKKMKKYNIQDVVLLEELWDFLLPWIPNYPNLNLYLDTDRPLCPRCGQARLDKRGFRYTSVGQYQRYVCPNCKGWCSDGKSLKRSGVR